MSESQTSDIKNLDSPEVQDLLNKFKKRNEINVVEVAEIISKLISTLKLDYNAGRPKLYSISGEHLGKVLGIGKGVVSQYLSVWNMPQETKNLLKNHNISLINAYHISRIKGKDLEDTTKLQKEMILKESTMSSLSITEKRINTLLHAVNEAEMVLNGIITSYKIPKEILQESIISEYRTYDNTLQNLKICKLNIEKCINYLSPKISKLPFLNKEREFCQIMIENNEFKFCNLELTIDCLNKQIKSISDEICLIETEQKLPHISSLLMMKSNLEKNIKYI